jgi:hypothetical protein
MEVVVRGEPEEIAALVVGLQERREAEEGVEIWEYTIKNGECQKRKIEIGLSDL